MPACPDLWFGVVDVRDVADLHLRAMTARRGRALLATEAGVSMLGSRTSCASGSASGPSASDAKLPSWIVRASAV